jgi:hypothetical protein
MSLLSERKFNSTLPDETTCIWYLIELGVFYDKLTCPGCGGDMNQNIDKKVFRCPAKRCKQREISLRKHTFFYQSKLSCLNILHIARMWLAGATRNTAVKLTGHSSATITSMYKYFRQLVSSNLYEEDQVIGGEGIAVEIDETKLGKRKFHRGHRVEGTWVVCGIERTKERKIFGSCPNFTPRGVNFGHDLF